MTIYAAVSNYRQGPDKTEITPVLGDCPIHIAPFVLRRESGRESG